MILFNLAIKTLLVACEIIKMFSSKISNQLFKKTSLSLALCLFSMVAYSSDKNYTCGNLSFDNINHSAPRQFKSLDEFLLSEQNLYIKESAKAAAENYFNKTKAKGEKYAYANSLDIFESFLEITPQVNKTIEKEGGLNAKLTETCRITKEEKFPIYELYNSYIAIIVYQEMIKLGK